jgi:hypothetical protein
MHKRQMQDKIFCVVGVVASIYWFQGLEQLSTANARLVNHEDWGMMLKAQPPKYAILSTVSL